MFVTVLMQVIVAVRMLMGVGMFVVMFMSVTVVGVLVRMCVGVLVVMFATGDMVVIDVHGIISFNVMQIYVPVC